MRTYVATYKIHTDYKIDKFFDVISTSDIKYKFAESKVDNSTVCYLTLIAKKNCFLIKQFFFYAEYLKITVNYVIIIMYVKK